MPKLFTLPAGPIQTNAYLLTHGDEGLLIDAPAGVWAQAGPILRAENCRLTQLWITHGHWDHMDGGAEVVEASGAKVVAHAADRVLLETPEVMEDRVSRMMGQRFHIRPLRIDQWVGDGDRLPVLGVAAEVRHVPGHCPGNVLFYFATMESAFVGDTLFAGSVGRTDLPGADTDTLMRSIRERIYTLPDATRIFPGHGPDTSVGREKKNNPFVRA